jgi:peptidoglycan/LPS O-acetylase OafA/YrhL
VNKAHSVHGATSTTRHDIQGLRAVAVLLVIANHLWGWPGGGFVGVDVFFVISGFLITGLLLREHERSGRISMLGFYQRRIKRILPAALTVTLVTVVVGYAAFTRARFEGLVADAFWATLFSANWRSIFLGTDYMHADDAVSPLQHFWSLSIEEQFYFVWPFILVIALTYGVLRPRRVAGIVIAAIGLASFVFALWETAAHPTSAYFSTFSRAWELAGGAFLALGAARLGRLPERWRPVVAWSGLALIVVSAVVMTDETPFPGPWALVPVLGAMAVIAAGIGGQVRFMAPLTNRVSGYVGNLSYSLYLWHFPVITFATLFLAEAPRRLTVVVLVVTALLSMASYHFIENPIRFQKGAQRVVRPLATLLVITVVATTVVTIAPRPTVTQAAEPEAADVEVVREDLGPETEDQWALIDDALDQETWPELTPSVDAMGTEDKVPEWVEDGCLGNERGALEDPIANAERCDYGSKKAKKVAVVYGDSIAISWVPAVRAALEDEGYRIEVLTSQQCPTANVATFFNDGSEMTDCPAFREWALEHIKDTEPDLVIAANVPSTLDRLASGAEGAAAVAEWEAGQRETLASLAESAGDVVVLRAPPGRNGSEACQTRGNSPADCLLHKSKAYGSMNDADALVASEVDVRYIDTAQWFCAPSGDCPSFTGTEPVLADGSHLSGDYSKSLGGVVREALLR